jgi:hypothetical protein
MVGVQVRRLAVMQMDEEPIEGCVGGRDIDRNPCWPGTDPSEWAMPDFSKKGTPWLLLGALAVAAWWALK